MLVKIIRIEDRVVSCVLSDGTVLDLDRKWLPEAIDVDDELDFCVEIAKKAKESL